jgi:hypothetical protein
MPVRSLNGWQRLGVFISTLIAVPSFLFFTASGSQSIYVDYELPDSTWSFEVSNPNMWVNIETSNPQMWVNKVYWDARSKNHELKGCVDSTVEARATTPYTAEIRCTETLSSVVWNAKWSVIIPFLVVFGIGYTISWIVAGFRQGMKKKEVE